jgi:hypothetical protein
MWGDRLLSSEETGYNRYESSDDGANAVIDTLSRDIVICDWHYGKCEAYPSVDIFGKAGFQMMISPWRNREAAESFLNYAKEHDTGHIKGLLVTTWCGSGDLAKRLLYGEKGRWIHTEQIAETMEGLFSQIR